MVLLGMIAATALPPWFFTPGIFSFAILGFLLSKSRGLIEAARVSWFFSFGFHFAVSQSARHPHGESPGVHGIFSAEVLVAAPALLASRSWTDATAV